MSINPLPQPISLALLVRLPAVRSLSLVDGSMAFEAKTLKIVPAEGEIRAVAVSSTALHWCEVMDASGSCDDAFALALLTEW